MFPKTIKFSQGFSQTCGKPSKAPKHSIHCVLTIMKSRKLNHQAARRRLTAGVSKWGFLVIRIKPLLIGENTLLFIIIIISPENKTA